MDLNRNLRIDVIARRQHGLITRAQLLANGVAASIIDRDLAGGRLQARGHGVYAVLGAPDTWEGRVLATQLATQGTWAAATGATAVRLLDLGSSRATSEVVRLVTPRRVRVPGAEVRVRPLLRRDDTQHVGPIRVTSPAWMLLDLAADGDRQLADVAMRLLSLGRVDEAAIADVLDLVGSARGVARLRACLADLGCDRFRSRTEHRLVRALQQAGVRTPEVNVRISGRARTYEVDLVWRDARAIVEVDGPHHALPSQHRRDRARDADLAGDGWRTLRVGVADVDDDLNRTVTRILHFVADMPRNPRM